MGRPTFIGRPNRSNLSRAIAAVSKIIINVINIRTTPWVATLWGLVFGQRKNDDLLPLASSGLRNSTKAKRPSPDICELTTGGIA